MTYDINYSSNLTTNEDFLYLKGKDLNAEFTTGVINDVGDDPAARAIHDAEEWMVNYIVINYDFEGTKDNFSELQRECFKKAICEQIDYILDNSDLRNLAGLNVDTGTAIDNAILRAKELAPTAFLYLRRCGLANLRRG